MRRLVILVLLALIVPCSFAQAQSAQAPKPGPEAQRLAFMLGSWQDQSEIRQSPLGPAGKETGTSTCDWFTGKFQMVCRGEFVGPAGKAANMAILGWDAGRKAYVGFGLNSNGWVGEMTGQVTGNTWTFTTETPLPDAKLGKVAKMRFTIVEVSPTMQTSRMEVSIDGGAWAVASEGKSTKVK